MEDAPTVLVLGPPPSTWMHVLLQSGCDAHATDDPTVALAMCAQSSVDVVIALMPMTGMATAAFCRELRRQERQARTPVLVAGPAEEWIEVINAGADEHIFVPCDASLLQSRVEELVRRFHGARFPLRVVRIGALKLYVRNAVTLSVPDLAMSPTQATLLSLLASQVETVVLRATLTHGLRTSHGPEAAARLDGDLNALSRLVAAAAGRPVLSRVDGGGWRLSRSRRRCRRRCDDGPTPRHVWGDLRP